MSADSDNLSERFARTIAHLGPIPLAQFMAESNAHYYAHRDPLGVAGDFITAPEISQMFGEMLGGWLADIALRSGESRFAYVELGPGRGTLARDALRVMRSAGLAPDIHLVEGSPVLRKAQAELLADHVPRFHQDVSTLPEDRPLLVVANEFFDALPIRQLVKTKNGWREIMVTAHEGRFGPVPGDKPMDSAIPEARRDLPTDTLVESCPAASAIMGDIAGLIAAQGGAMLAIDYGHLEPFTGSSLQAIRAHTKVDPFGDPGTADLTAHVDFAALAEAARSAGCRVEGMGEQGEFLLKLGIAQRASMLAQKNPGTSRAIGESLDRLVSPKEMGALFKVIALVAPQWPAGAVFANAQ